MPLPEETDYFYDDVVDLNDKTELQRDFSTEKSLSTLSPAILSHYVPGDTPTLYASARPNSSSYTDENSASANSGGTSYTFFGVPLPPLNLNNIWGKPKGTGKRLKDSRRNALPKKTSIDQDGFTPLLPGIGGFRPMGTTSDQTFYGEEVDNEEDPIIYRNKSTITKVIGSGTPTRYHLSTTTESASHYDRYPSNDYGYSKFVNITTRDSLYESATINSIIRSTAKPNPTNNQQQTASSIINLQSEDSVNQSESPAKLSTGNISHYI